MTGYVFKMAIVAIGVMAAGFIAILLFGNLWVQIGLGAAILLLCGVLLAIGWIFDRREHDRNAALDEL